METVSGVLTLVQEDRFQLAGEDGRKHLFVLSHRAGVDIDALQAFERTRRRVTVRHAPAKGLIAYVAEGVTSATSGAP